MFFSVLVAAGLYFYLPQKNASSAEGAAQPAETTPRGQFGSSVAASEITKISYSTWDHKGLLSSGNGYVSAVQIVFMSDGTATRTSSSHYDEGNRTDKADVYRTSITTEQFKHLAEAVTANDFFNESDSTNIRSEEGASLTVNYSGGEKSVKMSDIGSNSPEVEAILQELVDLHNQISWSKQ